LGRIEALIPKRVRQKISILSCWYSWILYITYILIGRDLIKAAYITVKTRESMDHSPRTALVIHCFSQEQRMSLTVVFVRSMYVVQALVFRMEGETVHVPYKKQENTKKEDVIRDAFYDLKQMWKAKVKSEKQCQSCLITCKVCHYSTSNRNNAVFFARQLWYCVFGIHNLANDDAAMYVYSENVARKGQNEVTPFLLHFLKNTETESQNLVLLSDGFPGQSKNYTMIHFLYLLVHSLHIFDSILSFSLSEVIHTFQTIRTFLLLQSRKEFATVETQEGWDTIIENSHEKPSPFNVVRVSQEMIFNIEEGTDPYFLSFLSQQCS
jgi:hypothetical protein